MRIRRGFADICFSGRISHFRLPTFTNKQVLQQNTCSHIFREMSLLEKKHRSLQLSMSVSSASSNHEMLLYSWAPHWASSAEYNIRLSHGPLFKLDVRMAHRCSPSRDVSAHLPLPSLATGVFSAGEDSWRPPLQRCNSLSDAAKADYAAGKTGRGSYRATSGGQRLCAHFQWELGGVNQDQPVKCLQHGLILRFSSCTSVTQSLPSKILGASSSENVLLTSNCTKP